MDQKSVVQTVELNDGGRIYKASYYIESGVLHADIAGKRQATVCMGVPARVMVLLLLAERVIELTTTSPYRQSSNWEGHDY